MALFIFCYYIKQCNNYHFCCRYIVFRCFQSLDNGNLDGTKRSRHFGRELWDRTFAGQADLQQLRSRVGNEAQSNICRPLSPNNIGRMAGCYTLGSWFIVKASTVKSSSRQAWLSNIIPKYMKPIYIIDRDNIQY